MDDKNYKTEKIIEVCMDEKLNRMKSNIETHLLIQNFHCIFMKTMQSIGCDTMQRVLLEYLHEMKAQGKLTGDNPEEEYAYFNKVLLQDEESVKALLNAYPEMERLLKLQMEQLLDLFGEIAESVKTNREKIRQMFCQGKAFEQVEDFNILISDPHNGGRRAARVKLDNGTVLYYKPHSIQKNMIYQKVYRYVCGQAGLSVRQIQYLDCGNHGWEEMVLCKPCKNEEEVRRYYTRMGIHLFLSYVLSATDLHGENLIASGEFPVIVDFETFPGVSMDTDGANAEETVERMIRDSVLRTGILPVLMWGKGEKAALLGALSNGDKIETPFRMPVMKNAGTSDMHYEYEALQVEVPGCVVRLNETIINAADYTAEVCRGFQDAYEIFQKDEHVRLLLELFFDGKSRAIIRHTQQYAMYRFTSLHHDFGKDQEDRRYLLSVLYEKGEDELHHAIHTYEIESLLGMDVPYFEVDGKSRSLFDGNGGEYKGYLPYTPYDSWKRKIRRLDETDMKRQLVIIQLSLFLLYKKPASLVLHQQKRMDETELRSRMETAIHTIARWVTETAVITGEDVNWMGPRFLSKEKWDIKSKGMYAYDGAAGIALFLAVYLKRFPDEQVKAVFERLKQKLYRYTAQIKRMVGEVCDDKAWNNGGIEGTYIERVNEKKDTGITGYQTGLLDGEGSLVYTYVLLYRITKQPEFLFYAEKHFNIVRRIVPYDTRYDYLSGNAGVIILSSELYELTGRKLYMEYAVALEKWLWKKAVPMGDGYGWKCAGVDKPLAGLAHGNSGFLIAYGRLLHMTQDHSYKEKIHKLLDYEDSLYSDNQANWLDLRWDGKQKTMNAWCHGAPGILLSRLELSRVMQSDRVERDMKLAAEGLFTQEAGNHICLCHGSMGNLLIMHEYLRNRDNREFREKYEYLMQGFLQNFFENGSKIPYEFLNPSLMNGISGVGIGLLTIYCNKGNRTTGSWDS